MDIINKIEIKHFRSFDGGKDQTKVRIDNLKDLNVFSGSNDSGKSNVLRALNLFFNNEISPGVKFDKDRDFSKIVANRFDSEIEERKKAKIENIKKAVSHDDNEKTKNIRRSDEIISIKIHFNNKNGQRGLPENFWISKLFAQKNNFQGEHIYQTSLKGNAQATLFLNSFRFEYIPAIKDRLFFNHLFEKLQAYLFEKGDKKKENKFRKSSENFNKILKAETEDLFQKFSASTGVDASFHIPSTLVDFFRTLSVKTENDISLFERGDGVQARFIPEILDEISKNSSKNIIWGFEEPENSYEAKNIRKLKDEFLNKYSQKKQIFITTHTKEFLSIKRVFTLEELKIINDRKLNTLLKKEAALRELRINKTSSDVSIYRVWKNETTNYTSFVTRFDEDNGEWEKTCDDLGIIQEARIIENLQEKIELQADEINNSRLSEDKQKLVRNELLTELKNSVEELKEVKQRIEEYEKPILFVEDKYDAIYKISYLKIKDVAFTNDNYNEIFAENAPFLIHRGEGADAVAGKLSMKNTDGYTNKKLIGLFDFDREATEKFYHLKSKNNWDNIILGDSSTGLYKKRNQHLCFYALLIPCPARLNGIISNIENGIFESFVEIENLLSEQVLVANNLVDTCSIMDKEYYKIKKDVKENISNVLSELAREEFNDFIPLFNIVEKLFEI